MLDDYKLDQPIVYKILTNSVKNNKLSHAYLFETNGYSKSFNLAISFSKHIFCPNKYTNLLNCNNCNQCKNIDNLDFLELKIIDADGQWIKKNQLDELQKDFSKKSLLGNKKVYIINNADKLNISSSNSLLKFLEEPEEGIYAILLVEKSNLLLKTIVSRCQVLRLNNNTLDNKNIYEKISCNLYSNELEINNCINKLKESSNIDKVVKFAIKYEEIHSDIIAYINTLWNEFNINKIDMYENLNILLLFYKDVLNCILNRSIEIFNDYENELITIKNKNTQDTISYKINVIIDIKNKLKYNVNTSLLMDKLIYCLGGFDLND